ncbi:Glutamate dehydrogenase (NADP(+)), partial [Trypanosoma cruzi]
CDHGTHQGRCAVCPRKGCQRRRGRHLWFGDVAERSASKLDSRGGGAETPGYHELHPRRVREIWHSGWQDELREWGQHCRLCQGRGGHEGSWRSLRSLLGSIEKRNDNFKAEGKREQSNKVVKKEKKLVIFGITGIYKYLRTQKCDFCGVCVSEGNAVIFAECLDIAASSVFFF